jgi:hypothetical protein
MMIDVYTLQLDDTTSARYGTLYVDLSLHSRVTVGDQDDGTQSDNADDDVTLADKVTLFDKVPRELYTKVARIQVNNLEHAFELCQNDDAPWIQSEAVIERCPTERTSARSLMVGDVLRDVKANEWWIVAGNGFLRVVAIVS